MVRRMAVIDKVGAVFGFILLLVGAIGVLLIGVFPDTGQDFFQDLAYGKIHNTVAIVALGGMGLGILWFGVVPYAYEMDSDSKITLDAAQRTEIIYS